MKSIDRSTLIGALFLIVLGVVFLVINLTGLQMGQTWPVIFFVLAAMFFLPALLWPQAKRGLAGLYIPGSIMLVLGLIFLYNVLTRDWVAWAFAWTLIPGSVGLGLWLGSLVGKWAGDADKVGAWMMGISVLVFALLGALFGSTGMKIVGPAFLVVGGALFLFRGLLRKPAAE